MAVNEKATHGGAVSKCVSSACVHVHACVRACMHACVHQTCGCIERSNLSSSDMHSFFLFTSYDLFTSDDLFTGDD